MHRNTGSFIELFTCRNCKKRIRTDHPTAPNGRHKNAPTTLSENENAPSPAGAAAADDRQRHKAMRMRSRSDDNADVNRLGFPQDVVGIPRISMSMSSFEISDNSRQSILKTPDNHGGDDVTKRHSSVGERRARFKEAVDVIIHDHHGNTVIKDRIRLKPSVDGVATPSECSRKQLFSAAGRVSRSVARGQGAFSLQSMRIERRTNGVRFLRLVIVLDESFTERSIHVCTANGGSRILVGAYRAEPLGDGTNYLRQYVDRFQLPHPIDAMSIQGELDEYGELVITAPVFDFDCDSVDNLIINK